ncbi:MAG: hypothetical protein BGO06_09100 [Shinella sp. 65-6]|nr:MAG: hypothetical protein BGO06_09100 [Shinella sp. 65-6]
MYKYMIGMAGVSCERLSCFVVLAGCPAALSMRDLTLFGHTMPGPPRWKPTAEISDLMWSRPT